MRWTVDDRDWARLREAAARVARGAYAPYSGLRVGAAALVVDLPDADGRTTGDEPWIVVGCNVENASYGLALCAECGLVSALHARGGGRLVAFVCVDADGRPLAPCGRCRQLLHEHGGPDLLVATADGVRPLAELLPGAFGPADLPDPPSPGTPGTPGTPASSAGGRG
ncbi:Cytidine deaminase [Frankia canadensis]|uniref:Cytidine deaminase n=1 Tax=Frankia canadensis TaxID=1836972 RepID=A0A2I2KMF2_9ACTN|nr:cytidine deaminase [Frankia canadensis]SNQ46844.1 Cytidine deaminase [Frankia canadensis]SOU54134.1 Cytidine deaminase [Frankia canadensis]